MHMQIEEAALFLLCNFGLVIYLKEQFQKMIEAKTDA